MACFLKCCAQNIKGFIKMRQKAHLQNLLLRWLQKLHFDAFLAHMRQIFTQKHQMRRGVGAAHSDGVLNHLHLVFDLVKMSKKVNMLKIRIIEH